MKKQLRLNKQRQTRKFRVSNAVKRVSTRPRLCVFRSSRHISAQVVDDSCGKTLASASTYEKDFRSSNANGGNVAAASVVGKLIAERALALPPLLSTVKVISIMVALPLWPTQLVKLVSILAVSLNKNER